MKCPNCGREMAEGTLYCEYCGEDIHIVPDFEPELELDIQQTISEMAEETEPDKADGEAVNKKPEAAGRRKKWFWYFIWALGILILAAAAAMGIWVYQYHSEAAQVKKAVRYTAEGKYEQAIGCYDRALELKGEDIELQFALAEVYFLENNKAEYEYYLRSIVKNEAVTTEQLDRAYGKLIAIYRAREDYQTINDLLLGSKNEQILSIYQNYIAEDPQFSVNEGYYTSIQILKLSGGDNGKIYYTTDGSEPDETSEVYVSPVILENGDYTIRAVFINSNGVSSAVVTKEYHIDNEVIPPPEVSLISGEYSSPISIEILEDGGEVYYTTDGSTPTENSVLYTGPIPMPLGKSTFCFARIRDGVTGEQAVRTFELTLNTDLTPELAVRRVKDYFLQTGKLIDEAGHFSEETAEAYRYEYQYVINIKEVGDYYIIAENLLGTDGSLTKTGTTMAVDIYSGECFLVQRDSYNRMVLVETEKKKEEDSREGE